MLNRLNTYDRTSLLYKQTRKWCLPLNFDETLVILYM